MTLGTSRIGKNGTLVSKFFEISTAALCTKEIERVGHGAHSMFSGGYLLQHESIACLVEVPFVPVPFHCF